MTATYDAVVVGAGCAGALISERLATSGLRVLLLDSRRPEQLTEPARDLVEEEALSQAGIDPDAVSTVEGVKALEVLSPDTATHIRLTHIPFRLVDRSALSRLLLDRAKDAGVHLLTQCVASTAEIEKGFVRGVVTDHGTFHSRLAVCASGQDRMLCRDIPAGMGIPRRIKTGEHISVYSETREVTGDLAGTEEEGLYSYHMGLYGGYAWTYSGGGTIDVGAGVQERLGAPDPRELVLGYVRSHASIGEKVLARRGGRIPTRRPMSTMVTNGLITAGDSACQAMPIVARGVGGALIGASMASVAASSALDEGEAGMSAMWRYNYEYMMARGAHQAALDCLRLLFQDMSEKELSRSMARGYFGEEEIASALSGKFAVPKALGKVRSLLHGLSDMSLLFRYESALKHAQKVLEHYEAYPREYDGPGFAEWSEEAEFLFSQVPVGAG